MGEGAGFHAAALDALDMQAAVLDESGVIRYTNEAWESFGLENDLTGATDQVGENYLRVCQGTGDRDATTAAEGIEAVLAGDRETFVMEYPCHSPDVRRWFSMRTTGFTYEGDRHALVVHLKITDRKLAEMDVAERNERLETVAHVLGHDIRNPLQVALGRLDVLADATGRGDAGEDDYRSDVADAAGRTDLAGEHLPALRSSLLRIENIVDDALTLAQVDRVADPEPVDLATRARAAWRQVETGEATLEVPSTGMFPAAPGLLDNVFENLFRNATDHGGARTVRVGPLGEGPPDGFYVADDGSGIDPDDREAVFGFGYTTGEDGTGLGLAIVRRIVEAHGWTVEVTGSKTGGARFEVRGVAFE